MPKMNLEDNELRDLLMRTNQEKLVDILISLYVSNNDTQKQLDIIFTGLDEDPKKIANLIRKEISSLKKSTRFIDYYESGSLADRLNNLCLRITNDLSGRSLKIAFEMMLAFMDLHKNILGRVDDSNGSVSGVFNNACTDLGLLGKSANYLSQQEIVQIVYELFMNNDYGIYDDIIYNFKDVLRDEGLDLLQVKFEQVADEKNVLRI